MKKILGLDLGTNSIGWAVVEKSENEKFELLDKGVRIFQEGVKNEKDNEKSKAAERTRFRSARRIKFRRKIRKYRTLLVLAENNMCPLTVDEVKNWRKSGFKNYPLNKEFLKWLSTDDESSYNPYYLRDKASKEKVSNYELGRALYHIAQRRGFLSNRLDQSDEGIIEQHKPALLNIIEDSDKGTSLFLEIEEYFEGLDIIDKKSKDLDAGDKELKKLYNAFERILKNNKKSLDEIKNELKERLDRKENLGIVKQDISDLTDKIEKSGSEILGQYFNLLYNKNRHDLENKIRNQYTARIEHYLHEFEFISKVQELESINEDEKEIAKRYVGVVKDLYDAIFYQRPLKSQKGLVGKCSFEKNKYRCPVSHPDFEEYRMWCFINNIRIKTPSDEKSRMLTQDEINDVLPKFYRKSKPHFDFFDIKTALGEDHYYNYKDNVTVSGCPISTSLKNILGEEWRNKTFEYKAQNNKEETVNRSVNYHDIWHVLFTFDSDEKLRLFAKTKLGLNDINAKKFSQIRLKKDYAALSLKAIRKITPYLKMGLIYSHAVFMANMEEIIDNSIWKQKEKREYIKQKTEEIINEHNKQNRIFQIVNGLITDCNKPEDRYSYSDEAILLYKKDIEKKLINLFGKKTWKEKKERQEILNETFNLFIKQFQKNFGKGEFLKIKRIDEKVIDFISGKNENGEILCSDTSRLKKLYHPSDIDIYKPIKRAEDGKLYLGSPVISAIKNPMAMRALHQLRKLINTLIKDDIVDEKAIVHIEMARELNDANKRKAIKRYQDEREEERKKYRNEIITLYKAECKKEIEPTEDDVLRYQLWQEQNNKEIYEETGLNIGICDIIGKNPKYDIEHTIPRSVSFDNSQMNKTLCSQRFNRAEKKDKIPTELANYKEILHRIEHWKEKYESLDDRIKQLVKSTKSIVIKEKKDKKIQERHYLTLHRDYWKGKYDRFIMKDISQGFKNSQLVDTGIITKYARAYIKSVFKNTYSVKGEMVDVFRKAWGLHESYVDEEDQVQYKPKDRSNHVHHCKDAITIACMTKDKYDVIAHAWREAELGKKEESRKVIENSKPWETFSQDVKNVEKEILVTHYTPDNIKKQSKKKLRKRGAVVYKATYKRDNNGDYLRNEKGEKIFDDWIYRKDIRGNKIPLKGMQDNKTPDFRLIKYKNKNKINNLVLKPAETLDGDIENVLLDKLYKYVVSEKTKQIMYEREPVYQQGDTARGSLHQESFYGAILKPKINKNGEIVKDETGKVINETKYVKRDYIENLSDTDLDNIVDKKIKTIVKEARIKEKELKK